MIIILIVVVSLPDNWQGSWSRPSRQSKTPQSGRGDLRGASVKTTRAAGRQISPFRREPLSAFWGAYIAQPLPVSGFTKRAYQTSARCMLGRSSRSKRKAPFWCARAPKGGSPSQFIGSAPIGEERLLSCDPPRHLLGP